MRPLARVLLAALLVPIAAQAQDISAPFVSRLRAQVQGTAVVLTWQDSPDAPGPMTVYRHTEEIAAENFGRAQKVAEVAYGTGSFTDHPSDTQPYFYAVIASDSSGRPYEVLVAFRNKTLSPRAIEEIGSPEEVGARIEAIRAQAASGGIRVTFAADRPGRALVLYRNTAPIARVGDLLGAVALILAPGTTAYLDTPPAGIAFYYAVADDELAKTGKARFVAGMNATSTPASVPLAAGQIAAGTATGPVARARPLPFLVLERGVYSGEGVEPAQAAPARKELEPQTDEAVSALLASMPRTSPKPMLPVVLEIDRAVTGGGEESILQSVVQEVGRTADKGVAEERLRSFLSIHRSPELEARARFYLGQVLYFEQRTPEALAELLFALDAYYVEAWPWVDRCLDELAGTL